MTNMGYLEVLAPIDDELHHARHTLFSFGEQDDNPYLDAGVGAGFLLGLHYACSYQKQALWLNRAVFGSERYYVKAAVDMVAGALAERVVPSRTLAGQELQDKLTALSGVDEGQTTTDTEFWPLPPKPPRDIEGWYGA